MTSTDSLLAAILSELQAIRAHFDAAAQPPAPAEPVPCLHEREVSPNSTIAETVYRCKRCGEEGI